MRELFANHMEACVKGGKTSSSKIHYCVDCEVFGENQRFYQHHVLTGNCQGRGLKNYWAKKNHLRWVKIFANLF